MPGGNAWGPVKSWTECEPVQCESECEKKQLELQAPRTSGLHQEGDFGVNGLPSGIARSREMKPEVGCEPSRASSGEESATFKNGVREVPPVESAWSQSAVNFVKQISPESQGSEASVCAAVRPHQLPRSHERASASCVSASCVSGCLQFACRMLGSPVQDNADHSDGISIRPAMKCLL